MSISQAGGSQTLSVIFFSFGWSTILAILASILFIILRCYCSILILLLCCHWLRQWFHIYVHISSLCSVLNFSKASTSVTVSDEHLWPSPIPSLPLLLCEPLIPAHDQACCSSTKTRESTRLSVRSSIGFMYCLSLSRFYVHFVHLLTGFY